MKIDAAIIGGTGIGDRLGERGGVPVHVPTADGVLRLKVITHEGKKIGLVGRHSAGHKVPPHRVPYLAMARGLKALGVRACLATAAVGSIEPAWKPGTLVIPHDVIDLTYRNLTLFDRTVYHQPVGEALSPAVRNLLLEAPGPPRNDGGVYLGVNGPRYETPQEIQAYRTLGADLAGMTASTEALVMAEAGVPYGLLAIVTNLAAGLAETEPDHGEVVDVMTHVGPQVVDLLLHAASRA